MRMSFLSSRRALAAVTAIAIAVCTLTGPTARGATRPRAAAQGTPATDYRPVGLDRFLRRYSLMTLDPKDVARRVATGDAVQLLAPAGEFSLLLEPHEIRSATYRAEATGEDGVARLERSPLRTFAGTVAGRHGSRARFTITDEEVVGLILLPEARYFVEPAARLALEAGPTDYVVYDVADVIETEPGTCGVTGAEQLGRKVESVSGGSPLTLTTNQVVELATEADFEYVNALGGAANANNEIVTVLNQVDGVFEAELGLSLSVVYQNTWTTASDPYTSTDPSTMLNELTDYWNANQSGVTRDVAHMWTGKDLNGSTIGIAWIGVVCAIPTFSYGLSQRYTSQPQELVLTAHELGHNFNASHSDGQPGCANTIMGSSVGTGFTFCQFSRNEITAFTSSNPSCLSTGGAPTITPASGVSAQRGSPASNRTVATVSDPETPAGSLTVTVQSQPTGITVNAIVNTNGTITANVAASCTAALGNNTVVLRVSDGSLTANANLTVNVTANTAPTVGAYSNTSVNVGSSTTVTPSAAPSDNGGAVTMGVSASVGFTGTLSVNPTTGVVSVSNAGPVGSYTVTVTATDNCGASLASARTFTLTVQPVCSSATTAIAAGQTLAGSLSATDCPGVVLTDSYADRYTFPAVAGRTYFVEMTSTAFDAYLVLKDGAGGVVAQDDNTAGGSDARIRYTVTVGGTYTVEATSAVAASTGSYSIRLAQRRVRTSTTGVFRPSNAILYLKNSNTTGFADVFIPGYGLSGDKGLSGDWNGDGVDTIGVFRNGEFYLRNANNSGFADITFAYGAGTDIPIVGDWNGDGIDTVGIYRDGTFQIRNTNAAGGPDIVVTLGAPGDIPISGDWNGDGIDTVGVFRPSNGALFLKNSNTTGFADILITFGLPGDKPLTGDWNGDGVDTIGVYRGDTFFLRNTNTSGVADATFTLGIAGDEPISGDWDGLP